MDAAASKNAFDTFTIGPTKEEAQEGIRVNAVCPGIIESDIHAGTAPEVARAIVWLTGNDASYTTGTPVDVAGGR